MNGDGLGSVDSLDERKIHYIDVGGVRTRYFEDGAGDPLVLLSGGEFGSLYSLDAWSLNLAELAKSFHVFALDKLGQGHTDNPVSDDEYTFDSVVKHVSTFVETQGLTRFHLVGHSRGGLVASWLAQTEPSAVCSLVIVDSGSVADHDPETSDLDVYAELGLLKGWDPDVTPTLETVGIEPKGQAYYQESVTDDFLRRLLNIAELPKTNVAQRRMAALSEDVWYPSVNRRRAKNLDGIRRQGFRVPTLIVWGMNDKTAPVERGRALFDEVSVHTAECEWHVLNGAGHCSFRDQPVAFNRVVAGFCGQHRCEPVSR